MVLLTIAQLLCSILKTHFDFLYEAVNGHFKVEYSHECHFLGLFF